MLGKTNTSAQSTSAGGDIIQAVNRTGGLINSGDKVWIVPQAQQAGDGFTILDTSTTNQTNFLTDNNCDYIRHSMGLYYLGNGYSEEVASGFYYLKDQCYNYGGSSVAVQMSTPYQMNILIDGEVILPEYTTSMSDYPIPSNSSTMVYWYGYSTKTIYSYNKETKETKEYINVDGLTIPTNRYLFIIDDILYSSYSSSTTKWYAKIDESSASFTKLGDLTIGGLTPSYFYPLGITNDKKIIGSLSADYAIFTAEIRNENELYVFSSEEIDGLEECYYNTQNIHPMFFPDSQILTYVKWNSSTINAFSFGVFKYLGDNKWQKLNIILPEESPENLGRVATQFYRYLAISTDLTKCIVGYWVTSSRTLLYRYQLENYDGNNIYKYRREIITENCLTGKANQDIESGQSGEVSTVLL